MMILLVNQDFSVDNFYELINPGYMLDYDKVQGLKEKFCVGDKEKILDDILKELNFDIYIMGMTTDIFRESYWLNAAFVATRFNELKTLERVTYVHRLIPIDSAFEDSSKRYCICLWGARCKTDGLWLGMLYFIAIYQLCVW